MTPTIGLQPEVMGGLGLRKTHPLFTAGHHALV